MDHQRGVDVPPFCGKNTVLRLFDRDITLLLEKRQMIPQAMLVYGTALRSSTG